MLNAIVLILRIRFSVNDRTITITHMTERYHGFAYFYSCKCFSEIQCKLNSFNIKRLTTIA